MTVTETVHQDRRNSVAAAISFPITLCLFLLPFLPVPLRAESGSMSLSEVYLQVLKQSEEDKIRREDLAIAEARYRQSLSSYFPQIFLFGRKTWNDRPPEDTTAENLEALIQENQQGQGSGNQGNNQGLLNDPYQAGVGFRWPIFSGFQTYNESRARDAELYGAQLTRERFRELLFRDVGEVFYQILEYQQSIQILQEEQRALLGRIGELARRVNIGRSGQGELLAARSDYSNTRVEMERLRGLESTTRELLGFLMGTEARSITLQNDVDLPGQEELTAYLARVEDRKDLKAAMQALDAEESRLSVAQGGHAPAATVEGNYFTQQRPDFGRDWGITLSIELPIFEGGATYYAVKESRAQVRQSKLQLESLKRSAKYEVRAAYADYVNSLRRLALLRETVNINRAAYFVQVRDYRLGIVTNLEVLDALRGYHASRRELVRLEMLARINQIRLHVAAGMNEGIPGGPADPERDDSGWFGSEDGDAYRGSDEEDTEEDPGGESLQ
jgi:outer membrane protein TolC